MLSPRDGQSGSPALHHQVASDHVTNRNLFGTVSSRDRWSSGHDRAARDRWSQGAGAVRSSEDERHDRLIASRPDGWGKLALSGSVRRGDAWVGPAGSASLRPCRGRPPVGCRRPCVSVILDRRPVEASCGSSFPGRSVFVRRSRRRARPRNRVCGRWRMGGPSERIEQIAGLVLRDPETRWLRRSRRRAACRAAPFAVVPRRAVRGAPAPSSTRSDPEDGP